MKKVDYLTNEYDKKNEEPILESTISIGQNIETFVQSQLKDRFRELNSEIPEDYLIEQIKEIIQSYQAKSEEEILLLKEQLGNDIGKYNSILSVSVETCCQLIDKISASELYEVMRSSNMLSLEGKKEANTEYKGYDPAEQHEKLSDNKYRIINNPGGGDCGIYALIDAIHDSQLNRHKEIRINIANTIKDFILLYSTFEEYEKNKQNPPSSEIIIDLYKNIFGQDGFKNFKFIATNNLKAPLENADTNAETRANLQGKIDIINNIDDWDSLHEVFHQDLLGIFMSCNTFNVDVGAIIHDHQNQELIDTLTYALREDIEISTRKTSWKNLSGIYYNYASKQGVWLNNSELAGYLITQGYIQQDREQTLEGTTIKFINNEDRIIGLFNNAQDHSAINIEKARGSHWQVVLYGDDILRVPYDELHRETISGSSPEQSLQRMNDANSSAQSILSEKQKQASRKEKYQADLKGLVRINELIKKILSEEDLSKDKTLTSIQEIGELIKGISWDEENHGCIRNEHGYRNRHKDKGNNINTQGARIDFETLAHLKDLAKDEQYNKLLLNNSDKLKASLRILSDKIDFIVSKKHQHSLHDEDQGFLRQVSAYYHDVRCVNRLLSLLDMMEKQTYKSLDLSNKVDRYWLGYLFVQIGEAAKEISEYIKPEIESAPEKNIIRFLFGRIGHYRQKIKGNPSVIYNEQDQKLSQIKHKIENAKESLKGFLEKIFTSLVEYNDQYIQIPTILTADIELIKNLTHEVSINSIFKNNSRGLSEQIKGLRNEIVQLNEAKENFELEKQNLQKSSLDSKKSSTKSGVNLDVKKVKTLVTILPKYLKDFPEDAEKQISDFVKLLEQDNPKSNLAKSLKKIFNTAFVRQLTEFKLEGLTLKEFFEFLNDPQKSQSNDSNDLSLKLQSLTSKIQTKEKQILKQQKQLEELENQKQAQYDTKVFRFLKQILHEIENLKYIEEKADPDRIEYARKMSLGFFGQCLKEVQDEINQCLKDDSEFLGDIGHTIMVRHKHIMHNVVSNPSESDKEIIKSVSQGSIIPWDRSFSALLVCCQLQNIKDSQYEIMLQQLMDDNPSTDGAQLELKLIQKIIFSFNRLGKYQDALNIYLDHRAQNLLNNLGDEIFELKFVILRDVADSFYCLGNYADAVNVFNIQLRLLEDKKSLIPDENKYRSAKLIVYYKLHVCQDGLGHKSSVKSLDKAYELITDDTGMFYKASIKHATAANKVKEGEYNQAEKILKVLLKEIYDADPFSHDGEIIFGIYTLLHVCYGELGYATLSHICLQNAEEVTRIYSPKIKEDTGEIFKTYKTLIKLYEADYYREQGFLLKQQGFSSRSKQKQQEGGKLLKKAKEVYQEVLKQNLTDNTDMYLRLGNVYMDLEEYQEAVTCYEIAKHLESGNVSIRMGNIKHGLFRAYWHLEKCKKSIDYLDQTINIFLEIRSPESKVYEDAFMRNVKSLWQEIACYMEYTWYQSKDSLDSESAINIIDAPQGAGVLEISLKGIVDAESMDLLHKSNI